MASGPLASLTVMPFGRFRGRPISEVDDDYLDWLLTDCQSVNNEFRAELEAEEKRRNGANGQGILRKPASTSPDPKLIRQIIQLGSLQKLTTISTKAEADAIVKAAEYMRRELGL